MSHISSSLRFLPTNSLLKPPTSSLFFSKHKTPLKSYHSIFSYYNQGDRRRGRDLVPKGRQKREIRLDRDRDFGTIMEEEKRDGVVGFNKRRAEGKDYDGKRRNLQHKTPRLNPVSTICYIQVLGTGMDTQDTSPSVLLFFDKQRFIFNAGEGLQRFCTEHKIKLSKIDHLFLTRVCSETAGGLPGLLLTLAGIGEEGMSVNIWGPSDLKYLVDAMKSFIPHATMVHTHSFGESQNYNEPAVPLGDPDRTAGPIVLVNDEVVRLSAILLRPNSSTGLTLKPGDIAVVYACELPEIRGKFDLDKAASLGLKRGPKYRELQLGNSVMSDDLSIMVHPSDVLGPSLPGPIVLIVDCPTEHHMPELFSLKPLTCYYVDASDKTEEGKKSVNCVIHMGPASITKNVDYQNWMKRFGTTQHIMAGHEKKNMEIPILKASARISASLNYLCPQFFPVAGLSSLKNMNFFSQTNGSYRILHLFVIVFQRKIFSRNSEIADVSKKISQFWDADGKSVMSRENESITMVEEPWINDASCNPKGSLELLGKGNIHHVNGNENKQVKFISDIPPCLENITREDMEITLLGTGSSQPSKYRNVSSIFINLFSKGSLLLDCGEGTFAQLKRRFGVEGADNAVKGLRCIWISHIHADHHTGLARILAARAKLLKDVSHEPLLVIGPRPLKRFLDAYSRLEDLDMQFLDCRHTTEASLDPFLASNNAHEKDISLHLKTTLFAYGSRMESHWKRDVSPVDTASDLPVLVRLKELLNDAGLEALYSVPVVHCPQAFGVVLKAAERENCFGKVIPGWKLVYSGDTRPCQSLVDASAGATVLIHEATFEDGMEEEAIAKNHSTTREAIGVGASAGTYRVILTHFSQRYPKIPVFDETHMDTTCIAFDLMSINAADLHVLPNLLPHLKALFKNDMPDDESDS